jgi:hypothetical protein
MTLQDELVLGRSFEAGPESDAGRGPDDGGACAESGW